MGGSFLTWVNTAADAHNAYLNLALTVGLPALFLATLWLVVLPLVDFYHRPKRPTRRP